MRVTLIHNPGAGSHTADADELLELLHAAGHEVRAQSARDAGWQAALAWPAELVAVAGGDGTVSRVAKAMLGRGVPLAPLPAGTANNIARTLELVERPWEDLIRAWPEARRMKLDIGLAKGPWGERHFVEGVGAGLFACLLRSRDPARKRAQSKRPSERVASALEILSEHVDTCEPVQIRAHLDGKDLSGRYLLCEALNIPYVGPNLHLAPDSRPGDGSFELILVGEAERERLRNDLCAWQQNRERLAVLPSHRGTHLQIEWDGFAVHIDDELWPEEASRPAASGRVDLSIAGQVELLAPGSKEH